MKVTTCGTMKELQGENTKECLKKMQILHKKMGPKSNDAVFVSTPHRASLSGTIIVIKSTFQLHFYTLCVTIKICG
jgi:hypothetical protein